MTREMSAATIFALASGRGRAGIAVVRISGPRCAAAVRALTDRGPPPPRRLTRTIFRTAAGEAIDDGLMVWFPGPQSFTGEDVAEFHVHGGRAVITGIMEALAEEPGLRLAEPGEFSRRAFIHGKMDLTEAEGLADLIAAETAAQRQQALRQMHGALGRLYEEWRQTLLRALAHQEAAIDFSDEDIPDDLGATVADAVEKLATAIERHLSDGRRGERIRDGIEVVIVGPPNAGKSSLLNAMTQREAAIVSPHPGTTRDVIEVAVDLGGYPVVFADTAGLREDGDVIEREGVRRAKARAAMGDVRIVVFDGAAWPAVDAEARNWLDERAVAVVSKGDLGLVPAEPRVGDQPAVRVSVATGEGLTELRGRLTDVIAARFGGEDASLTRQRHREALRECLESLRRCRTATTVETVAEDLRQAAHALGRITGRMDVEAILDVVFGEFCIGK